VEACGDTARPLIDYEALIVPDGFRTVSYLVPALVAEDVLLTNSAGAVSAYRMTAGAAHPVQMFGTNTWNDIELAKRVGSQIRGALFVDGFNPEDAAAKKFAQRFQEATRSKPQLTEAQMFDAAALLGSLLDGQKNIKTRDELRRAIVDVKAFAGVTGSIQFDAEGDSTTPPHFFRVESNAFETVDEKSLFRDAG
jgi:branched-chain amino acid transport system substrate-binding protein